MTKSTRYVIVSASEIEGIPPFYFRGWGSGGEVVPVWGMGLDRAELFVTRARAETFIAEKLPFSRATVSMEFL